jgi:hypothetical protein
MPANISHRDAYALRESIAPGPPRSFAVGIVRHERAETQVSGAIIAAVRRALPEGWACTWAMTGGGCSAWEVYRPANGESGAGDGGPYLMLTGAADHTESSGDLSHGAVVGLYLDDDGGEWHAHREAPGQPAAVAAAVAELLTLAHTEED